MVDTRIKNESFKGKNNPAYGKSPKERLSKESYECWRQRLKGKYYASAKKVICVNTGEIFTRIGLAAEKYNLSARNLGSSIYSHRGVRIKINSKQYYYVFDFYEEGKNYDLIDYCYMYNKKSVICLETKEIFWTSNDAGNKMGFPGSSIARVCTHKRKQINGYHFMYVKDYIDNGISKKNLDSNKKRVVCLTTGEIFNSVSDAKRKYTNSSTIGISCKKDFSYSGKLDNVPLVWQFYDDYLISPKDCESIIKNNTIHCITSNLYFADFNVASKYAGVCCGDIRDAVLGKHKYAGKDSYGNPLVWEFYTHTLNDGIVIIKE